MGIGILALRPFLQRLGPILYGLSLAVLSFGNYALQSEFLKGSNEKTAFVVLFIHMDMGFLLSMTLSVIAPSLALALGLGSGFFATISVLATLLWVFPLTAGIYMGAFRMTFDYLLQFSRVVSFVDNALRIARKPWDYLPDLLQKCIAFPFVLCGRFLEKSYGHIGGVYIAMQWMLLVAACFLGHAFLGAAALSFFALEYARAKNYLSMWFSTGLEKLAFWIRICSGIFLQGVYLKLYSFLMIGYQLAMNYIVPIGLHRIFGKSSAFLRSTKPSTGEGLRSKISRDVSLQEMQNLFLTMPVELAKKEHILRTEMERIQSLGVELLIFLGEYGDTYQRAQAAGRFLTVRPVPQTTAADTWYTRLKNWLNLQKNKILVVTSHVQCAVSYLDLKEEKKAISVTVEHMAKIPFFMPEPPVIDYARLWKSMINSDLQNAAETVFKKRVFASVKFQEKVPLLKKRIENFNRIIDILSRDAVNTSERKKLIDVINSLEMVLMSNVDLSSSERMEMDTYLQSLQERLQITPIKLTLRAAEKSIIGLDPAIRTITQEQLNHYRSFCRDQSRLLSIAFIPSWREHLALGRQSTENEVIVAYIQMRLEEVLRSIRTGEGLLWDKSKGSLKTFQSMGQHLLAHCQALLESGLPENRDIAHTILADLAVEAGNFCANALYDVVIFHYNKHVLKKIINERMADNHLSAQDKLAYYLQQERQTLFEQLYGFLKDSSYIAATSTNVDFGDRHTYSAIVSVLSVLHLRDSLNAESDLSNNRLDFKTRIELQFYGYVIARLLLILEHGYSASNILERAYQQHAAHEGYEDSLGSFNFGECLNSWISEFTDPEVRTWLESALITYDAQGVREWAATFLRSSTSAQARLAADYIGVGGTPAALHKQICALMLLDKGVFHFQDPEKQRAVEALLAPVRATQAREPRAVQIKPPILGKEQLFAFPGVGGSGNTSVLDPSPATTSLRSCANAYRATQA